MNGKQPCFTKQNNAIICETIEEKPERWVIWLRQWFCTAGNQSGQCAQIFMALAFTGRKHIWLLKTKKCAIKITNKKQICKYENEKLWLWLTIMASIFSANVINDSLL